MASPGPATPALEEVRAPAAFDALRDAWTRLFAVAPDATPFQTWEWNRGFVESAGDRLRVVVARDGAGEVAGIAPLRLRRLGIPGVTALQFLGDRVSDYLDVLAAPGWEDAFASRLADWIRRNREWSVVDLHNLRQESLARLAAGVGAAGAPADVCPYAVLPPSLEEYERSLPGPLRKSVVKGPGARLAREGRVAFAVARDEAELRRCLPVFFTLHQLRQRSEGERGRFFDPRWCATFTTMSLALLRAGYLRLTLLRIDGRPAAAGYSLRVRDREYFYSTGMDPALAEHRPGNLLKHRLIGEAIQGGVRLFDFGRGDEPYKAQWANARCEIYDLRRARTPLVGLVARGGERWRRRLYRSRTLKRLYRWTLGRLHRPPGEAGHGA